MPIKAKVPNILMKKMMTMMNKNRKTAKPLVKGFSTEDFDFSVINPLIRPLDNGLLTYTYSDALQETLRLEFVFEAGSFFQDKKLQAQACCSLLTEGSVSYTADQISERLDFYGAYIEKYCDRDQASIVVYCLSKYISNVLPILEELIKRPVFPSRELDIYISKALQKYKVSEQKVSEISRKHFYALLYGPEHPYGKTLVENDFALLSVDDLKNFHARYYTASSCKIILAGAYDEKIFGEINTYFGSQEWMGSPIFIPETFPYTLPKKSKEYIQKKGAVQACVRIGKVVMPPLAEDYYEFQILNYVFGGYFGSRLMKNIREEKGYTYGIGSYTIPLRYSTAWMISSEVKAQTYQDVLKEIYKEMDKLCNDLIPETELALVRSSFYGEFLRDIDGIFDIAEKLKFFLLFGLNDQHYVNFTRHIEEISPEKIREMAQKYFVKDSFIELTTGS